MHRTARRRDIGARMLVYGLLVIFLIWTIGPIYWTVATSFKGGSQLFTWPPTYLPTPPVLTNYEEAFIHRPLLTYARNSAIVAAVSTPLSVSLAALAAFAFGRYRFRGRATLMFLILAVRMLPGLIVAMPLFLIFQRLELVDNLLGLIIAYTAFNLPFNIWLLQAFFAEIPREVEDAAVVDGASPLQLFFRIMVPMAAPGLVASTILCLLLAWNEFGFALILTYTLDSQTLPIAIAGLSSDRGTYFGAMAAAGTLAVLPVFAFAVFIQRYLVRGLTAGAVKG
ncbi:MAG: carbohydrate ABC transporter permease [Thermomicrobiales bacterium]